MLWTFGAERSSDGVKGTDRHGNGSLNLQPSSYLYPVSFIPGRANASPSNTQGGSPVRESRPPGSVRGAPSNGGPYRDIKGGRLSRYDRALSVSKRDRWELPCSVQQARLLALPARLKRSRNSTDSRRPARAERRKTQNRRVFEHVGN